MPPLDNFSEFSLLFQTQAQNTHRVPINQSLYKIVSTTETITVKIPNRLGMHARPATMFAEIAGQFEAEITVAHGDHDPVDGKSIMQLMMLAATQGTALVILATGGDADVAIEALHLLVTNGFNE